MLTAGSALTSWAFDPLAVAVIVGSAAWYGRGLRRLAHRGERWPWRRTLSFAAGLVIFAGVTLWWVGAYAHTLFWVYTVQIMTLLVIAPALMMFGKPITLARATAFTGKTPLLTRIADAPAMRVVSNPAFGALLLPLVTLLVFFTAVLPTSLSHYVVYEFVHLVLLVGGFVLALPLADEGPESSSMSIAAGILFGFLELLADAVPGIAIRLRSSILGADHYLHTGRRWGPSPLHDQRLGGAIVWFLAETIDLPVLAILVVRWIRADEREAVAIDRRLDLESAVSPPSDDADPARQRPWWETDASVFGDRRGASYRRPQAERHSSSDEA